MINVMPDKDNPQEKIKNKWASIEEAENLAKSLEKAKTSLISVPDTVNLKIKNGLLFGLISGIGFCLGFIVSLLLLFGLIGFYLYSRFPQLFR